MRPKARDGGAPRPARGDPSPDRPLIAWRQAQLRRAGFDPGLAARVATDRSMDVHALLELVDLGCPPDLAVRIVAPLDHEWRPC